MQFFLNVQHFVTYVIWSVNPMVTQLAWILSNLARTCEV